MQNSNRVNRRRPHPPAKQLSPTLHVMMPPGTPALSLEELEGDVWGEPEFFSSLVLRCHELRKKPFNEFVPSDLRILIGQQIGLTYLMPLALHVLEWEPLLDAEYYQGDLLSNLVQIDPSNFQAHPEWLERSIPIVVRALSALGNDEMDLAKGFNAFLRRFEDGR